MSKQPGEKRSVCVVLVDRANYGRLKPVMEAISNRPQLELQVICAGTMLLERFDQPVNVVRADGFCVNGQIHTELEGSIPLTMAKSVGFGIIEFTNEYGRLRPDIVLIIGDRYEALSATIAAAYMNIPILHMQGGEVSGSIDESARHAISKLSQFHYPATQRAKEFLLKMGEQEESILGVGCPASDLAKSRPPLENLASLNERGSGIQIDFDKPFLLAVFHPTTTEYGDERAQMEALLGGISDVGVQTILLWPNIDAGSDRISKAIREHRAQRVDTCLRTLTNLPPEQYLAVLGRAACAVGNSSSFVRDAGFMGTPVVLVGNRQNFREYDVHVLRTVPSQEQISSAISDQLAHGKYAPSSLYGDGNVAVTVANRLVEIELYVQKHLSYVTKETEE